MKRIYILALTLVMSLFIVSPAGAANDLSGHYFENDMKRLIAKGIMEGFEDGSYRPDAELTRAQFAQLIVKALDLNVVSPDPKSEADLPPVQYTDVKPGAWYEEAVAGASKAGIISGYPDGSFKPNDKISRQHMAIMVANSLKAKGMIFEGQKAVNFADSKDIQQAAKESVQIVYNLNIIKGTSTKPLKFSPKAYTTRGMAAATLNRTLTALNPPKKLDFEVAVPSKSGMDVKKDYATFDEARKNVSGNEVVVKGNKIVWMASGIAAANKFTEIYEDTAFKMARTYVPTGTELKFIGATEKAVQVELAGKKGYVKQDNVNLIPPSLSDGRSYYKNENGQLVHYIFNPISGKYASTGVIGAAPSFMTAGQNYYSWDGASFTTPAGHPAGQSFQYFQFLPLSTASNYSAAELDKFLETNYPDRHKTKVYNGKKLDKSPLVGTGKFYKAMEAKYKVNALYLMAHAIHESDWGTSVIAQEKNNLYGMQAYDSDALKNAKTYKSFEESIEDAAKYVSGTYQNPKGAHYNGAVLGNKTVGMNVKYASDPYWGEKAAGHMYRADQYLGRKDFGNHELGFTTEPNLNIRNAAGTKNTSVVYTLKNTGIPVVIKGEEQVDGAVWYKIQSDDQSLIDAYAYGKGTLGEYVKKMPVAK